ncbi:nitrogen fixation protein FixH [Rhodoblastus acidophilus]|uniref:FixH family protein n=1 Tax=Rhodoblastus acidophilus TaxID=1074 RepID=UPI0022254A28|nr:FixH family protein [Rhodoblastus acidophilus]MCW2284441.1 nitrogen fixation protein FixH [Rhodoblastus acidophilus]MCW2333288.1 nitrogen fixation protein FixH [Rhodoblastus acidophilus]
MTEDSDYQPAGRPLTGRSVLLMLMAFFGVMLAVNVYMAREAVATHPGLDQRNPYDEGVAYNKEIAAARAQDALGWSVDLTRARKGAATEVTASVKDKAGQPVSGLQASLHFVHPSSSRLDKEVAAGVIADGLYAGAADLTPGHWLVEIAFTRDGETIFRSKNTLNVE